MQQLCAQQGADPLLVEKARGDMQRALTAMEQVYGSKHDLVSKARDVMDDTVY